MAKVLIVDDDEELVETVEQWLKLQHHTTDRCLSGTDATQYLLEFEYDVVILDWNLPGKSGIDVLKEFRSRGGMTPLLMLTGRDAVKERTEGLDAGADDYLTKPFHPEELVARVRALLRRPAKQYPSIVRVGDFVIDPSARRLTRHGIDIPLQPMEFAMLEFFLHHPNEVYSTETLLQRVWDSETEASLDAVYSCIKRLRQKLQIEGQPSLIKTVHRSGYRLDWQPDG